MNDLLTIVEAAALTTIPVATLRYWRHVGRGPVSFKVGHAVRYRRIDVERWLRDQHTSTASGGG